MTVQGKHHLNSVNSVHNYPLAGILHSIRKAASLCDLHSQTALLTAA